MNFFLVFIFNFLFFVNNGDNDVDFGFDDDGVVNEVSWVK